MNRIIILFTLLSAAGQVMAETRYVVDELTITLRSGASSSHQIVKLLKSGARLEVLSEIDKSGTKYAQVKSGEVTGWVLSQYLTSTPIARDRIARNDAKVAKISQQNTELQQQLASLREENQALTSQRDQLNNSAQKLDAELTKIKRVTARPLAIEKNNETLRRELATRNADLKLLTEENARLKDRKQRDWFIAGAGVTLISILLGVIMTRIRWRKRSSWGSRY